MRKSQFLGISILNPGEGLDTDNYAFTTRDRELIDYGIRLGAKQHRHNGVEGLRNPVTQASGLIEEHGGTIPAGLTISLGYTLEDFNGGETQLSPTHVVGTGNPLEVPTTAPSAVLDTSSGALTVGTYYYAISFLDGNGGETPVGPTFAVDRPPGFETAQVVITGIAKTMPEGSVAWRLYRAINGGTYELLTENYAANGSFTDDGTTPVNCDIHPVQDSVNETGATKRLKIILPIAPFDQGGMGFAEENVKAINFYASLGNDFSESSLLGSYPFASANQIVEFTELQFLDKTPPDVNTSFGGANKIDPDTELIDWHWKRPVENKSELPGGENGDVRIVTSEAKAYILTSSGWEVWNQGGGGGEGGPGRMDVFKQGAAGGGSFEFTDDFSGGELDTDWEIFENAEPLSTYWIEEGGKIHGGGPIGIVKGLFGKDMTVTAKFGGTLAFYCAPEAALRALPGEELLLAGYSGGIGHGFGESAHLYIRLHGTEGGDWTLAQQTVSELPAGEFWVVSSIKGSVVTVKLYHEDPALEGEPSNEISLDITSVIGEPGMPSAEELAPFLEATESPVGLSYVGEAGAEGAFLTEAHFDVSENPSSDYISEAAFIEFASGAELDVASAVVGDASGALVTIPLGGGEAGPSAEPVGVQASGEMVTVEHVGSAYVVTANPPHRHSASAVATALAGSASVNLDFVMNGPAGQLIQMVTDKRARVRVYGDAAARTADAVRGIGEDPTGDHGVQLDYVNDLEAGGGKRRLTPAINAANLDEPPQKKLYLRLTNMEASTQTVTVSFTYIQTEGA